MAGVDATRVLVGAPDQSGASGAISRAPLGVVVPTSATEALGADFTSGGYVSSDGVTVTPTLNTTGINDWSGAEVRKLLESFTGEVAFSFIQFGADEAAMIFGDDNVETTPADEANGTRVTIKMGARMPDPGVWVFRMKDGKNLIRIVLPNATPSSWPEMPFLSNAAIPLGTTLACAPDEDGNSIYIYTDDGVFSA